MVVAEKWAEQRVLMRAYADARDQTRPTIVLHGDELAIGPAGIDTKGPWGIHVPMTAAGASSDDGRAQDIRAQLEAAARRLAGSRGNPPRLADEESTFDRVPTGNWAPPGRNHPADGVGVSRVEHAAAAMVPITQAAEVVAGVASAVGVATPSSGSSGSLRRTPAPRSGRRTATPVQKTALGYQSGAGAQSALVRLGLHPHISARLGRLASRTVSVDFQVSRLERAALNAIGDAARDAASPGITARELGELLGVADPVGWMEELTSKLERYGVDVIEPGDARGGEPTYVIKA